MKVLWFEVSEPAAYVSGQFYKGGWQDSLERIVKTIPEIELLIAFRSDIHKDVKEINGVTYIPFPIHFSFIEKKLGNYWDLYRRKLVDVGKTIVEKYKPDIIQVFGTEWPFGQIAAHTNIPVVIHIMGAMIPCNNAAYPPGYSYMEKLWRNILSPTRLRKTWKSHRNEEQRVMLERNTWKLVRNYMGRTHWDESLSRVMHPGRRYFHVEEALRLQFVNQTQHWHVPKDGKIRLVSTGCGNFWKGPDMMLKVAKILKNLNVDFVWNVAGRMNPEVKKWVESKIQCKFSECNVNVLGFISPDKLVDLLCSSTMYVHTAYIENSPNSICEAQCLGIPVISTNVGGIASLVRHGTDGILIPANDPWQMADTIIQLASDKELMLKYSENSRAFALKRHKDENIKEQLLHCYQLLMNNK